MSFLACTPAVFVIGEEYEILSTPAMTMKAVAMKKAAAAAMVIQ